MLLNLLNLYSLIFALFSKIEGMSKELDSLKPVLNSTFNPNSSTILNATFNQNETSSNITSNCTEVKVPCIPCELFIHLPISSLLTTVAFSTIKASPISTNINKLMKEMTTPSIQLYEQNKKNNNTFTVENLIDLSVDSFSNTTRIELEDALLKIRKIANMTMNNTELYDNSSETYDDDYIIEDPTIDTTHIIDEQYSVTETISISDETSFEYSDNATNDFNTTITSSTKIENSTEFLWTDDVTLETYKPTVETITEEVLNITRTSEEFENTFFDNTTIIDEFTTNITSKSDQNYSGYLCPDMIFKCTIKCADTNITLIYKISNCTIVEKYCLIRKCYTANVVHKNNHSVSENVNASNVTLMDVVYLDKHNRKMYNLTVATKTKLLKLCWETMFGQELVKLTMMDLVI